MVMKKNYIVPNVVCLMADASIMAASPGQPTISGSTETQEVVNDGETELGSKKSFNLWRD